MLYDTCLSEAQKYYANLFMERTSGITKFWKVFGKTTNSNKEKDSHGLSKLIRGSNISTDDEDIAKGLKNYFCNIGKQISPEIKTTPGEFHIYPKNKIDQTLTPP